MTLKLGIQLRVLDTTNVFIWWLWIDLDYFYDKVRFVSECFGMGDRGYSDKAYILPSCPRLLRPNFQTGPNVSQLHGSVGKCINFSTGVTSQQFVAFKFVKICVFRTHPSFSRFHTGYHFDQISSKCRGTFQRRKRWNVDGRNVMQFQKVNFLSLRMHKRFAWRCDVCHLIEHLIPYICSPYTQDVWSTKCLHIYTQHM